MDITRRGFFLISTGLLSSLIIKENAHAVEGRYATLVDITRCDGCSSEQIPKCVEACREQNRKRFPEPKKPILPYWPRKTYEDWSDRRDKIDTLTPYNWIFVQKATIEGRDIFIPRRCMHCDNPPCVRGCPFGALTKRPQGNSVINEGLCFGGAKCRDVCPWHIPQRQAGVGIYLHMLPKYAGGGVMYKCDLCKDRIEKGEEPACVVACRQRLKDNAVFTFGERRDIYGLAKQRKEKEGLYLYGDIQNGGTSTLYLSKVPFEAINRALIEKKDRFKMPVDVKNKIQTTFNPIGKAVLSMGFMGMAGAIVGAIISKRVHKGGDEDVRKD
ncbi:MAG TPA: 4Fe-4S dicluster domain-containing protein [Syntrophorhabdaceae bacterium]|nr:4Fe-4S dicluster domain-containing protein [Syntrophorhabdaceae bacterium]HOL06055.1 4Fe-4S dicluster domain-containing protein [Syntrophorhabdaceae bacterium]HON86071.1 4Fe-4S dicluster domain-containing protein [Syntrophorhabdaceae bacterium]HPC66774.1 4Fe-4S dicluster domain-containing protein [Syntrophorhabdaceae bacterium]HPP41498.1 4Fe-4S dicluster domain-containing protein [Syntrophorhabdaceae bacterium]